MQEGEEKSVYEEKRTIKCNLKVELLWKGKLAVDEMEKESTPHNTNNSRKFFLSSFWMALFFYGILLVLVDI